MRPQRGIMRYMASVDALAEVVEQHLAYHQARPNDENNPPLWLLLPAGLA